MRPRLSMRTVAVIGAGALVLPALGSVSFASTSRVAVAGSMPDWARSAQVTGSPSSSSTLTVNVVLPLRGGNAAEQLAQSISDPTSANYGKYQTAAQFNAQFAPTAATVSTVRSYLTGQGLKVAEVADGNRWISVSGSVKQVDAAFGVTLKNFSYKGQTQVSPTANAKLPANIASLVAGVTNLDSVSLVRAPQHVVSHSAAVTKSSAGKLSVGASVDATDTPDAVPASTPPTPSQCSVYWGQYTQTVPTSYGKTKLPTYNCGYSPQQLRSAYGISGAIAAGDTGKGVTVAITDAYANPTMLADANAWSTLEGIPQFKPGQYTEAGTSTTFNKQKACAGEVGWNEEEALDIEAVHGMAPGATINYVGAKNCDAGLDDSLNWIIQTHAADIVSNSWGDLGEAGLGNEVTLEHSLFTQGAIEGIGFYFASGDDGDETDSQPAPVADYPGTDPLVTAVGGTSLGINQDGSRLFESEWGTAIDKVKFPANKPAKLKDPLPGAFWGGSGGGTSSLFAQPFYQKNIVPSSLSELNGSTPMRVEPDVALDADPFTGYFVLLTEGGEITSFAIGGTSLSTPLFAGMQALASQGRPVAIGFANPLMYNLHSVLFNDVKDPAATRAVTNVSGSEVVSFGFDTSLNAVKGYDNSTGLGAPNGNQFLLGERF